MSGINASGWKPEMARIEGEAPTTSTGNRALMLDQNNSTVRQKLRLMEQLDTLPQDSVASLPPPPPPSTTTSRSEPPAALTASGAAAPDVTEAVLTAVRRWADAWAAQDVEAYLAAYAPNFDPGGGMSRSAWADLRRQRISAPASIRVEVIDPQVVRLSDAQVRVSFTQVYESDTYADRVNKVLELQRIGDRWLITREYAR